MRQPSATHRSICQDAWALGDVGRRPLKPLKFKGRKVYHYYPLTLAFDIIVVGVIAKNRG